MYLLFICVHIYFCMGNSIQNVIDCYWFTRMLWINGIVMIITAISNFSVHRLKACTSSNRKISCFVWNLHLDLLVVFACCLGTVLFQCHVFSFISLLLMLQVSQRGIWWIVTQTWHVLISLQWLDYSHNPLPARGPITHCTKTRAGVTHQVTIALSPPIILCFCHHRSGANSTLLEC